MQVINNQLNKEAGERIISIRKRRNKENLAPSETDYYKY